MKKYYPRLKKILRIDKLPRLKNLKNLEIN